MRIEPVPVTSYEVRWFLEGSVAQHDGLKQWFQTMDPWPNEKNGPAGRPEWRGNAAGRSDVYLVVPGARDMGIKWREGSVQIKGRIGTMRTQTFCSRFQGALEHWIKWSYDGLSAPYREMFLAPPEGVVTVEVRKDRALRKVRLDALSGTAEEVDAGATVDRALTCELTDVEVNGTTFCSLGFEAFPADATMPDAFVRSVEACFESLPSAGLTVRNSFSYPAWLGGITGCNARLVAPSTGSWRRTAAGRCP